MNLPYESKLTKSAIWELAQNKPTLIAKDLELFGISKEVSYKILLARGVFKWLGVRRSVIKLKNLWKDRVNQSIKDTHKAKSNGSLYEVARLKGYRQGIEECRAEVRALCHSERWQCPDFDKDAVRFLKSIEN